MLQFYPSRNTLNTDTPYTSYNKWEKQKSDYVVWFREVSKCHICEIMRRSLFPKLPESSKTGDMIYRVFSWRVLKFIPLGSMSADPTDLAGRLYSSARPILCDMLYRCCSRHGRQLLTLNRRSTRPNLSPRTETVSAFNLDYSTVALVPPMSTMYVWRGIT